MPTEEEIFSTQISLIKEAVIILEERIKEINQIERDRKYTSNIEAEKRGAIGVFKYRSLLLYKETLSYIANEVIRDKPKISYFLLPHVRTILDVYARFVHLLENCSDEDQQALACIAYQLLLPKYLDSELEYQKGLELYKNFLIQKNFIFPQTLSGYSKTWVKNNGLAFSDMKSLLTTDNFKKYSINVYTIFGTKDIYRIYSGFSEFLHGNPYYYNELPHNEKFWVISTCISIFAFFIEMVDSNTFNKRNRRDFRVWLDKVKKNKQDFVKLWKSKKIPAP